MARTINGLSVEEYFKQVQEQGQGQEVVIEITPIASAKEKIEELKKQSEIEGEIV